MTVLEITHYSVSADRVADYLEKRPTIEAALQAMPGLRWIRTGRLGDHRFVDVGLWDDHAAMEQAQEAAMTDPRLAPLFEWLEDVAMETAEVPDR